VPAETIVESVLASVDGPVFLKEDTGYLDSPGASTLDTTLLTTQVP
jgi:hypothetical protein